MKTLAIRLMLVLASLSFAACEMVEDEFLGGDGTCDESFPEDDPDCEESESAEIQMQEPSGFCTTPEVLALLEETPDLVNGDVALREAAEELCPKPLP